MRILLACTMILWSCGPRSVRVPLATPTAPIAPSKPEPAAVAPSIAPVTAPAPTPAPEVESTPPPADGPAAADLPALLAAATSRLQDAYFDYDRADLGSDAVAALRHNASILAPLLAAHPQVAVIVEGHCDERGSAQYNLALGDRRAVRAAEFLEQLGLDAARFEQISYGSEKPQCTEPAESCWNRNRRAHFRLRR